MTDLTGDVGVGTSGDGGQNVDELIGLKLAARPIRSGMSITFDVTLRAAAQVTVQIRRLVPAPGQGEHRGTARYVVVGTLRFEGKTGLNRLRVSRVDGHGLRAGRYEAEVSAGGKPHRITFTVKG